MLRVILARVTDMYRVYRVTNRAYILGRVDRYKNMYSGPPLCLSEMCIEHWHRGWFDANLEIDLVE